MKKLIYLFFMVILLSGCATTARLYPVDGPLSKNPVILKANYSYWGTGSGNIVLKMPDGEVCQGEYTTLRSGYTITSDSQGGASVNTDGRIRTNRGSGFFTIDQYGSYWGSNIITAMENKQRGQATLIGDKGTIMEVEYFTDVMTTHGFGLAKDNKGNIYKVHF